jgi:hypothetical protein
MGDVYPRTGGCARRLIDLRCDDAHHAVAWLEDDFHHFGVTVQHDGGVITDVRAAAPRFPYSTCPAAGLALKGMIGRRLSVRATDVGMMIPMRQQCTHLFDLAGLAMAQAAGGRARRRYEATITDREIVAWEPGLRRLLGPGVATLRLNQEVVLEWRIDGRAISGPADWAGQRLTEGFRERTEAMPVEPAEHAAVLRRAILISSGRSMDPDLHSSARARGQSGVCHTFLEENRDKAQRMVGSTLNYQASSDGMLSRLAERP